MRTRWAVWWWLGWRSWFFWATLISSIQTSGQSSLSQPSNIQTEPSPATVGSLSGIYASVPVSIKNRLKILEESPKKEQNSNLTAIRHLKDDEYVSSEGRVINYIHTENGTGVENQSRWKRKVISRGGHYIIRTSSGSSPWSSSSTSYDTDSYSPYRTSRPRGYGWNPRGRIGDGGIRPTTFGEHLSRKQERRSTRKKLGRSFKGEIAQYAMQHGVQKAALHYENMVGRRLRDRVVEKFVQRYQERVKKAKKRARS